MPKKQTALATASFSQGVLGLFTRSQEAKAERVISKSNERIANVRAEDALKRGQEAVSLSRRRTKKLVGSQRASIAAQGIRTDVGSAQDVQQEAQDIGELDALTIKNNAAREALGFKTEAISTSLQGRIAAGRGRVEALDTLAVGGLRTAKFLRS